VNDLKKLTDYLEAFERDQDEQAYGFLLALFDYHMPKDRPGIYEDERVRRRGHIIDHVAKTGSADYARVGRELRPAGWEIGSQILINKERWEVSFVNKTLLAKGEKVMASAKRYDCAFSLAAAKALREHRKRRRIKYGPQ
jgi:hypothetical protein